MLTSTSLMTVHVQIREQSVEAVVDTAAEVTIISDRVYKSLQQPPRTLKKVKLQTAGREMHMSMQGLFVEPVKLNIGYRWYPKVVHVDGNDYIVSVYPESKSHGSTSGVY
jgi:hypothetical protein